MLRYLVSILFVFPPFFIFLGALETTSFAEDYTLVTVKKGPPAIDWMVQGDYIYRPITFTDGTVINDGFDKNFIPQERDQLQLVRAGGWYEGFPLLRYYTTRWNGGAFDEVINECRFIHISKQPNHVIARVQKIHYQDKVYPLITLKDGSTWILKGILKETLDSETTDWNIGKSILIFKNYSADHPEYPYLLIQPNTQSNLKNPEDPFSLIVKWNVIDDSAVMGWIEFFTIPDGEYTLEDW